MKTVKLIISGLLLSASKLNLSLLNCVTMFALLALTVVTPGTVHASGGAVDTMSLTDEPGNWFKSELTGTPFTVIKAGERVDFKINNCCTSTKHTVTLLMKPTGSNVVMDQDQAQSGTLSVDFDLPGVYLFHCKIHPYMTAVVGVTDASGNIPDVTSAMLPFIGIMGVNSLPAETVLSVITTVAATDAYKLAKWEILDSSAQVIPSTPGVGEVWVDTQFERAGLSRLPLNIEAKAGTRVLRRHCACKPGCAASRPRRSSPRRCGHN